jgi:Holliday junction DNA helicase RuvA
MTSVPGVGKKTAQKIILELKGQLVEDEGGAPGDAEVIEAMMSLGYSSQDARAALKTVPSSVTDVSERVRESLKSLSK